MSLREVLLKIRRLSVEQQSGDGNVASGEKIHRSGRDLQHCGFHLSFILIVITGCVVTWNHIF